VRTAWQWKAQTSIWFLEDHTNRTSHVGRETKSAMVWRTCCITAPLTYRTVKKVAPERTVHIVRLKVYILQLKANDRRLSPMQDSQNSAGELPAATASGGLPEPPDLFELPPRVRSVLHREPVVYREALLGILRGNDAALAAAAVRLLLALVQSRAVDPELLDVAGAVFPMTCRRVRASGQK